MSSIRNFKNTLGPVLAETFSLLVEEMLHDGAPALIEQLEKSINTIRYQINEINNQRHTFSQVKYSFETIYKKLTQYLEEAKHESLELLMLKIVLKSRIESLEKQIKETRPDKLLQKKSLLKNRKSFLLENSKLALKLMKELD